MAPNGPRNSGTTSAFGVYASGVCKSNLEGTPEDQAKLALKVLKQIENAGGSKAFEAWCKQTDFGRKKVPSHLHVGRGLSLAAHSGRDVDVGVANVTIIAVLFYSSINVTVPGANLSGSGGAPGLGVGGLSGSGDLNISNGQDVQSWAQSVTGYEIGAVAGSGVGVFFYSGGNVIGSVVIAGTGFVAAVGFGGSFGFSD